MFRPVAAATVLAILALLSACSNQSPDQNPVIKEKFVQVDELGETVKGLRTDLSDLELDVNLLSQDVTAIKTQMQKVTASASAPEHATAISNLETQNVELAKQLKALQDSLAESQKTLKAQREAAAPPTARPGSAAAASVPTPTRTAPPENKVQKGVYYLFKEGDTVTAVAKSNGLSAAQLRSANRLPGRVEALAPGTRIFIPQP
jgi:LysM repeat protein